MEAKKGVRESKYKENVKMHKIRCDFWKLESRSKEMIIAFLKQNKTKKIWHWSMRSLSVLGSKIITLNYDTACSPRDSQGFPWETLKTLNISNLRYADDTTLMAESEEERKSLLMKVKEESEKVGIKLNVQKTKIMASGPITSWQIDGETVADFIFGGLQNHCRWWLQPWN